MAFVAEKSVEILSDDIRVKRTARKSTFVPKKMVPTPAAASHNSSSFSRANEDCLKLATTPDEIITNNSSKLGSICNSPSSAISDCVHDISLAAAEKFLSVEEIQTARIRKLQTARKSVPSDSNRLTSPSISPKVGPVTRNSLSSVSSQSPLSILSDSPKTSRPTISELSESFGKCRPRIREFRKSLRGVPDNVADLKIPMVSLDNDMRLGFDTAAEVHINRKSSEDLADLLKSAVSESDERRSPVNKSHEIIDEASESSDLALFRLCHSEDSDLDKNSNLGDENLNISSSRNVEDPFLKCFNQFSVHRKWIRGRKPKKRRFCKIMREKSTCRINANIVESLTEAFLEGDQSPLSQPDQICLANVLKPLTLRPPVAPTGNKLSLLQHLPNIDVIDDVEFLSFETEDDLHRFVKRHPSYTLDFTGKNGLLRKRGEPIRLTKTTDVTKIKGWRHKIFASSFKPETGLKTVTNDSRPTSLFAKPQIDDKADEHGHENSKSEKSKEDNDEESLDLDVYDESSRNSFSNGADEVNNDEKSDNDGSVKFEFKIDSNWSQAAQEQEIQFSRAIELDDNVKTTNNKEPCNKSAFISDYLDDFLRNKSELKTTVPRSALPSNENINTRVVWPTQAGSPSREMSMIKPPPFQTWNPVRKNIMKELEKSGGKSILATPSHKTIDISIVKKPIGSLENVRTTQPLIKISSSTISSWKPVIITLTDAIYAANAVIANARARSSPKYDSSRTKKRKLSKDRAPSQPPSNNSPKITPFVRVPVPSEPPKMASFLKIPGVGSLLKMAQIRKASTAGVPPKMAPLIQIPIGNVPLKITPFTKITVPGEHPKMVPINKIASSNESPKIASFHKMPITSEPSKLTPSVRKINFLVTITKQNAEIAASALNVGGKLPFADKTVELAVTKPKVSVDQNENVTVRTSSERGKSSKVEDRSVEEEARPPSPYSVDLVINGTSNNGCSNSYCQLGCVCDSLRTVRRKRRHCGKVLCMFNCTCKGTVEKVPIVDTSARLKRQIRLPARLKDSFLWNGGRDLPLNFDWDMSVHRKGDFDDEQRKFLWKSNSKWGLPAVRGPDGKKKIDKRMKANRRNKQLMKLNEFTFAQEMAVKTYKNVKAFNSFKDVRSYNSYKDVVIKQYGRIAKYLPVASTGSSSDAKSSSHSSTTSPVIKDSREAITYTVDSSRANLQRALQKNEFMRNGINTSRANLTTALSKQLPQYKPCILNLKRVFNDKKGWEIVRPKKDCRHKTLAERRLEEPNQMLPHDWRFITKPLEDNPENWSRSETSEKSVVVSGDKRMKKTSCRKRKEMKFELKRLSVLIKPWVMELREKNPAKLDSKLYLVEVAALAIKELKQGEVNLLLLKSKEMKKRQHLFKRYLEFLVDVDNEGQKTLAKILAKSLQACCLGRINQKDLYQPPGYHMAQTSNSKRRRRVAKGMVSTSESEDVLDNGGGSESYNSSDEDGLDEPKVVIENDLEDECEINSTIVDISSDNIDKVPRGPSPVFTKLLLKPDASSAAPSTSNFNVSTLNVSGKQWRKLIPASNGNTNITIGITSGAPLEYTSRELRFDGSSSNVKRSKSLDGLQTPINPDERTGQENPTFKMPTLIKVKSLSERRSSLDGTVGEVNRVQLPAAQSSEAPENGNGTTPFIQRGTRLVLYPCANKSTNGVEQKLALLSPQNCNVGSSGPAFVAKGANNNGFYACKNATILVPISVLPPKTSGATTNGAQVNGSNSIAMKSPSGIILRPIVTTTTATATNSSAVNSNEAFQCPVSTYTVSFKKPARPNNGEEQLAQFLVTTDKNGETIKGNPCFDYSRKVARARLPTIADATNGSELEAEPQNVVTSEEMRVEQCDNEDDSEMAKEEMPKIVGFSSISEDEFRCKEDSIESLA